MRPKPRRVYYKRNRRKKQSNKLRALKYFEFKANIHIKNDEKEEIPLNIIWLIILISGIVTMLFTDPDGAVRAMLTGSTNAVNLAISLIATYGFWLGFFALMDKTGISDFIARLLRPLIKKLFKGESADTEKFITMNMSANLLGLGNASTPMGINAINSMNKGKPYATTNMIMLVVISATSLQLIPSTVIGMRIAHGSASPTAFLLPCTVSTVASTVIGIILVKLGAKIFGDEPRRKRLKKNDTARSYAGGAPLTNGKNYKTEKEKRA